MSSSSTAAPTPWMIPPDARWLAEYRTLLNKWELFVERATLDVELGKRYRQRQQSSTAPAVSVPSGARGVAASAAQTGSIQSRSGAGFHSKQTLPPSSSSSSGAATNSAAAAMPSNRAKTERLLYRVPPTNDYPHIYLKCHYCGTSLPMDAMQASSKAELRAQKNILNCCASCSQELPRCYVCRLYMVRTYRNDRAVCTY